MTHEDPIRIVLERHRDDDSPRIDFSVPVDRLMDDEHCDALSRDLARAAPQGWEVVKATRSAWRSVPDEPGLYMFVWQPRLRLRLATSEDASLAIPWILYVGKAGDGVNGNNLRRRYKQEYASLIGADPESLWSAEIPATREQRLARYLNLVPLSFWYCVLEDGSAIHGLERRLFNLLAPPLNTAGSRRLRPVGKSRKAF